MSSLAQPMIAPTSGVTAPTTTTAVDAGRSARRSRSSGPPGRRPRSPWSRRGSGPTPGSGPPSRPAARTAAAPGRTCRRPQQQHQARAAWPRSLDSPRHREVDGGEGERAEQRPHRHHRERQAHVADPVHQERLLRGGGGGACSARNRSAGTTPADALPADEHQQVVAAVPAAASPR